MELDPLPSWWQPGAMALLLVDLQQGTCGDAQPRPRPAFDRQFRTYTQPAAQRTLVVIGLLTDQCIDHTVKDAADRGYQVVCLTDACQAETPERHGAALDCFRGYAALLSVDTFTALLKRAG